MALCGYSRLCPHHGQLCWTLLPTTSSVVHRYGALIRRLKQAEGLVCGVVCILNNMERLELKEAREGTRLVQL